MAFIIDMPNVVPLDSPEHNRLISQESISQIRERFTASRSRRESHAVIPISVLHATNSEVWTSNKIGRIFNWLYNYAVTEENNPTHLKTYIDLLTTFGISPLNSNYNANPPLRHWILFIVLSVIVIYRNFSQAKIYTFVLEEKGNLLDTIRVLQLLQTFVESVYLCYLFSTKRIFEFLKTWPTARYTGEISTNEKCCNCNISKVLLLFTIFSCFALSIRTDRLEQGESFNEYLLDQAEDFFWSFFLWSYTDADKKSEDITNAYASKLTGSNTVFAIVQIITVYLSWFQILAIRDLVLVVVLDLYIECNKCKDKIMAIPALDPSTVQVIWETYDWACDLSTRVNACFGRLFIIIHIQNWLYCSYFLLRIHQGDWEWTTDIMLGTIRVVKLWIFYYCCYTVGTLDEIVSRHVTRLSAKVMGNNADEGVKEDIILLNKAVEVFRPGIGEGYFHVDGSFLVKFGGSVVSCFILFANTVGFNQLFELIQSRFQTNVNCDPRNVTTTL